MKQRPDIVRNSMSVKPSGVALGKSEIFRLVQPDLEQIEKNLRRQAGSSLPLIDEINQYLHNAGGKRLRPTVLMLCARMLGQGGEAAVKLGGVVELIHVATLVHDDIIDNARVRRGRASVNARWGNQITVLVGDWMYMTAFYVALELQNFRILDILIDITRTMVEGELIQLEKNGRLDVTAEDHIEICLCKTACLFSGCGRLAGIIGQASFEQEEKLAEYGRSLGMAFQLTDDLLDYTSDQETLGKPVLKDLEEGKVTLPIIFLLQRASRQEREFIQGLLDSGDFSAQNKAAVMKIVQSYGTLEEVRALACQYAAQATACVQDFPASIYRDALIRIPELVIQRDN